jgi:hypothetical protein
MPQFASAPNNDMGYFCHSYRDPHHAAMVPNLMRVINNSVAIVAPTTGSTQVPSVSIALANQCTPMKSYKYRMQLHGLYHSGHLEYASAAPRLK